MRPLYFLLYIVLNYMFRIVFSNLETRNAPTKRNNCAIIVSNHPSAFMDPLLIAGLQKPIVFFMTRSDVFKPFLRPVLWAANMLPIYRNMDGVNATLKNKSVFEACFKILKRKRSPLLFGEGLTDDVFERKLKPLKKGAARMAFGAMNKYNWELDLEVFCVGMNYEDPTRMRSKMLISNAAPIQVSKYKKLYEENADKAIDQLTLDIENAIKGEITQIDNNEYFTMHEQVIRVTRKGMHTDDHDPKLSIKDRQQYSKKLADQINTLAKTPTNSFLSLKDKLDGYFTALQHKKVENKHIFSLAKNGKISSSKNIAFLLMAWPFAILGIVLMGIPYWITKWFVERTFKRKVFWLSVKMAIGMLIGGVFNIGIAALLYRFVYPNIWITLLYYFTVPAISFLIAYQYRMEYFEWRQKQKVKQFDLSNLVEKRNELEKQINLVFRD
ncbi:MAG: 1-acyl-sn-glycerol-3-phosphate acyltransferase [Chitinophagales bacterium]